MLIFYLLLTFFMITVMVSDVLYYRIPNWLVLALIVFYPVMVLTVPVRPDWMMACLVAFGTFAVSFVLLLKFMGGGDIKLLTAAALYVNKDVFLDFIVYVAIIGGIGTLFLLALRLVTPFAVMKLGRSAASIPRVLTDKEPVPYGVAIGIAFLLLLWGGKLPGLSH